MSSLPDGHYDVFVVDAGSDGAGAVRVELAIVSGDQKGEVVVVRREGANLDPLDLLGLPGVLDVVGGTPRFRVER